MFIPVDIPAEGIFKSKLICSLGYVLDTLAASLAFFNPRLIASEVRFILKSLSLSCTFNKLINLFLNYLKLIAKMIDIDKMPWQHFSLYLMCSISQ